MRVRPFQFPAELVPHCQVPRACITAGYKLDRVNVSKVAYSRKRQRSLTTTSVASHYRHSRPINTAGSTGAIY